VLARLGQRRRRHGPFVPWLRVPSGHRTAGLTAEAAREAWTEAPDQFSAFKAECEQAQPRLGRRWNGRCRSHRARPRGGGPSSTWALRAATRGQPTRSREGWKDVSTYPALFAEPARRGCDRPDCAALAGGNMLARCRSRRGPMAWRLPPTGAGPLSSQRDDLPHHCPRPPFCAR